MKMKKKMILTGLAVALVAVSVMGYANVKKPKAMRRTNDGTYIVTTGKIGKNIKGYAGQTPVKVYIKNDAVVKVEALPNEETAGIFSKVREKLLVKWNGMKVEKIVRSDVDGVSGATYSSKAVKENVKCASNITWITNKYGIEKKDLHSYTVFSKKKQNEDIFSIFAKMQKPKK